MHQIKALVFKRGMIIVLAQFSVLVTVATLAPLLKQQAIVGPLVNATLFIATLFLGAQNAILVGLVPSLIALSTGLLPPVMAPIVPFIMMANTILVLVFNYLRRKNYWLGVISASFLKFLFLFFTSSLVINLIVKKEIAQSIILMMSWPQFITAIAGGLIAYFLLRNIKNVKQ